MSGSIYYTRTSWVLGAKQRSRKPVLQHTFTFLSVGINLKNTTKVFSQSPAGSVPVVGVVSSNRGHVNSRPWLCSNVRCAA